MCPLMCPLISRGLRLSTVVSAQPQRRTLGPADRGSPGNLQVDRARISGICLVLPAGQQSPAQRHHRTAFWLDCGRMVWTVAVVFGRIFFAGFYWLGLALIVGGIAGTAVGVYGGGIGRIEMTTGLIAAASLFAAGGSTIAIARARQ